MVTQTYCHVLNSGFCGLEVACWPLVPKYAGSNPAEAVGFLRVNKNPQHVGGHGCLLDCCVLSSRGLCDELITRSEESYRLWCVVVCDLRSKLLKMRSHTQSVVIEPNRRRITGCISYKPLIVT